ncbi:hypothetical protein D3C71_1914550 [compost metagenome]
MCRMAVIIDQPDEGRLFKPKGHTLTSVRHRTGQITLVEKHAAAAPHAGSETLWWSREPSGAYPPGTVPSSLN